MSDFAIKTENFEGPLDLLLSLVEKRKLFINDISLAKVADDFIAYVQTRENMPIDDSAHFILIASTLLLIKSRSLLPTLTLSEEESGDVKDLETRLKIYELIRNKALEIKEIFGSHIMFGPIKIRERSVVFSPFDSLNKENVLQSIRALINSLPETEKLTKTTVKKIITLEEMIGNLAERISKNIRMSFKDFSKTGGVEKVNVIVGFLAMLELVKKGAIRVKQEKNFADIEMESGEISTPNYGF